MEGDGTGGAGVHERYDIGEVVLWGADAEGADVLGGVVSKGDGVGSVGGCPREEKRGANRD